MEKSNAYLPVTVQEPISRFDYYSNRLKLEYLVACFTREFNPSVLEELKTYYDQDVRLAGGMNEAFRWFLGNPDVESIEALTTGEPFTEKLKKRQGTGLLFKDYNPRSTNTFIQVEAACQEILTAYIEAPSIESKLKIMTEFFAVKVTCHDIFIHGRSDLPASHFFQIPFVHIDPDREIEYITQVLESPLDDFRVKNILSYAMASGIDPVNCLSGAIDIKQRDRSAFIGLMKTLLEKVGQIEASSFFRWDIYGICNFIEGPVFLRKSSTKRCVGVLSETWANLGWDQDLTCTQASDYLARQAFSIIFDHSKVIQSGSPDYFSDPDSREKNLKIIQDAEKSLDELFECSRENR